MRKTKTKKQKINFILTTFALMLTLAFSAALLYGGKAYAQSNYFNDYYVGINGGVVQTSPSGLSSKSGGTINMSLEKTLILIISWSAAKQLWDMQTTVHGHIITLTATATETMKPRPFTPFITPRR